MRSHEHVLKPPWHGPLDPGWGHQQMLTPAALQNQPMGGHETGVEHRDAPPSGEG